MITYENAWYEGKLFSVRLRPVKPPLMGLCSPSQPPLVQTQTVTITAVSNSMPSDISTTDVPIVPTKTFTYESSKVGAPAPDLPDLQEVRLGRRRSDDKLLWVLEQEVRVSLS